MESIEKYELMAFSGASKEELQRIRNEVDVDTHSILDVPASITTIEELQWKLTAQLAAGSTEAARQTVEQLVLLHDSLAYWWKWLIVMTQDASPEMMQDFLHLPSDLCPSFMQKACRDRMEQMNAQMDELKKLYTAAQDEYNRNA